MLSSARFAASSAFTENSAQSELLRAIAFSHSQHNRPPILRLDARAIHPIFLPPYFVFRRRGVPVGAEQKKRLRANAVSGETVDPASGGSNIAAAQISVWVEDGSQVRLSRMKARTELLPVLHAGGPGCGDSAHAPPCIGIDARDSCGRREVRHPSTASPDPAARRHPKASIG
jgi:hypothetical protein